MSYPSTSATSIGEVKARTPCEAWVALRAPSITASTRPLSATRLAHTYVFPSDQEVFILNSFYREGELAADKSCA